MTDAPRPSVLAPGALGAVALAAAVLPGAIASGQSQPTITGGGVLRLHLNKDADYFRYLPPTATGGATVTQTITAKSCVASLNPSSSLVTLDDATPAAGAVGLVDDGLGVKTKSEGTGTPCGRVDGTGQALTLALVRSAGSALQDKLIDFAELDIEGKFDVTVRARALLGGRRGLDRHLADRYRVRLRSGLRRRRQLPVADRPAVVRPARPHRRRLDPQRELLAGRRRGRHSAGPGRSRSACVGATRRQERLGVPAHRLHGDDRLRRDRADGRRWRLPAGHVQPGPERRTARRSRTCCAANPTTRSCSRRTPAASRAPTSCSRSRGSPSRSRGGCPLRVTTIDYDGPGGDQSQRSSGATALPRRPQLPADGEPEDTWCLASQQCGAGRRRNDPGHGGLLRGG